MTYFASALSRKKHALNIFDKLLIWESDHRESFLPCSTLQIDVTSRYKKIQIADSLDSRLPLYDIYIAFLLSFVEKKSSARLISWKRRLSSEIVNSRCSYDLE